MAGIDVDGARPAVEWVTCIPRSWQLGSGEQLVLLALACDSYDGLDTYPGRDNLAEWTGMLSSSVGDILTRLEQPSDHRPALIRRTSGKGGRGKRARVELLRPNSIPTVDADQYPTAQPTGDAHEYSGQKPAAKPATKPTGDTGNSLPFPGNNSRSTPTRRRSKSAPTPGYSQALKAAPDCAHGFPNGTFNAFGRNGPNWRQCPECRQTRQRAG